MKKKTKREKLDAYIDFEQKLPELQKELQGLIDKYGDKYTNLRFESEEVYYAGDTSWSLYGDREETDEERKKRLALDKERRRNREEMERAQLAELKRKYEES